MPKIGSGEPVAESWGYYPNGDFSPRGDAHSPLMQFVRSLRRCVREGWTPQQVAERIAASEFESAFMPEVLDEWQRSVSWLGHSHGRHIEGTVANARFQRPKSPDVRVDPDDVRKLIATITDGIG